MRLLFLAEAVTLAHVARPFALASGLAAAGHDIAIACAASYSRFASACGLPVLALHSLQPAQFLAALAAGRPVYDDATLVRYVDDDLRLMRAFQPDLVVGDFRLSLSVSARLAGVPYAAISNAYWSPACSLAYPLPELPLTRHLPLPLARVSLQQYALLIRALRRTTRDELWGLCSRPLRLGSFGHCAVQLVACRNLEQGLRATEKCGTAPPALGDVWY